MWNEIRDKVRALARGRTPAWDLDDAIGDGMLAAVEAVQRYDPLHPSGASLWTFVRWSVLAALCRRRRERAHMPIPLEGIEEQARWDGWQARADLELTAQTVLGWTPRRTKLLVEALYEHDGNVSLAAAAVGMHRKTAHKRLRVLRDSAR